MNDYIKNFKFQGNDKIYAVTLELLLAKYIYMLNRNIYTSETKKEFLEIIKLYSNGTNKKDDQKITTFFKFLFNICSLEQIILIFDKNDINIEFPFDLEVKLYNLYNASFSKLIPEKSIFEIKKTKNIIEKIFQQDGVRNHSSKLSTFIKIGSFQLGTTALN